MALATRWGFLSAATFWALALGCSGTEFTNGQGSGAMAGMSATGGDAGTGGTGTGGKGGGSGKGGGKTGGTGGTGGSGATGSGGTGVGGTGGSGTGGSGNAGTGAAGGAGGTTGGAGGTAGTMGGTAGTGGSPCVEGGDCDTEMARCSEGGCCAAQLTCTDGKWGNPIQPPCVAPTCPQEPPQDGSYCSVCQIPSDGCTWDQRPVDGPLYTGTCVNDQWVIEQSGANGCCMSDDDCPGAVCVDTKCKVKNPDGCWRDEDCSGDQICGGVYICPCGADCAYNDAAGLCVPKDAGCCGTDAACKDGERCVKGVCEANPVSACWSDRDCTPGGVCSGASVCACGDACLVPDHLGMCLIPL